jgi:hypothetical protein
LEKKKHNILYIEYGFRLTYVARYAADRPRGETG